MKHKLNASSAIYEFRDVMELVRTEYVLDQIPTKDLDFTNKFNLVYRGNEDVLISIIPLVKDLGFTIYRESVNVLYIFKFDVSIRLNIIKAPRLSTLGLSVRCATVEGPEFYKDMLVRETNIDIVETNIFELNWYFMTKGELNYSYLKEVADDVLLDEAYPNIKGGVDKYINDYLDSDESVLILIGPPGTGKTRLIRHILGTMSNRMGKPSRSIYTGDQEVFKTESVFIQFVTEDNNAFVIEDADFLLDKRSDGNKIMHNFLKAADGLISSQGRKMIFSVNLTKSNSIDDALMRPGRCYDVLDVRHLTMQESQNVANIICKEKNKELIELKEEKFYTLASLYKLIGK